MTRCDDEYDDDVRRDDLSHAFVCLPGFHCLSVLPGCLSLVLLILLLIRTCCHT